MKKYILFAIFILFIGVSNAQLANYSGKVTLSGTPRANDTWEINHSVYGIQCSTAKCMEIIVKEKDTNVTLEYQTIVNGFWYQNNNGHNTTPVWRGSNFTVILFRNSSYSGVDIYYNNVTQQTDRSRSILLWYDNFESYAVGSLPARAMSSNSLGRICQTNGQKAVGCDTTGGNFVSWNVTEYSKNVTAVFEINNSASDANDLILQLYGNNSYRIPQITTPNSYAINYQGGATIGTGVSFVGNSSTGYNVTMQSDNQSFNFWINHIIKGGNSTHFDVTRNSGSMIAFQPSISLKGLLSLKVWNQTIQTYTSQPIFTPSLTYVVQNPNSNLTYYETQPISFNITINGTSVNDILSVSLNYNGTNYALARASVLNSSYIYRSQSFNIPNLNTPANNATQFFFYNITVQNFDGSTNSITSSNYNITVFKVLITQCNTSETNTVTLNFTMKDEKNVNSLVRGNMQIAFDIRFGSLGLKQFGFNSTNLTSHVFCLSPVNATFTADVVAQYEAPGYSFRNYYIVNGALSNATQNIDLFLLNSSLSTLVTMIVKEPSGISVSDALVKMQKFYPDENLFRLIAMGKTNQEGKSFINLEVPNPSYKILVEQNGVLVETTQSQQIDANGLVITLTDDPDQLFSILGRVSGSCFANATSRIVSCTYSDATGLSGTFNLTVQRQGATMFTGVCSEALTSTSGTLICDLSSQTNGTYFYDFNAIYSQTVIPLDAGSLRIGFTQRFGDSGYFLAFMLFLVLFFIGIFSPSGSMVFGVIGLVAGSLLELQPVQFSSLVGLFFTVLIATWKAKA